MKNFLFVILLIAAIVLSACGGSSSTPGTTAPIPPDYSGKTNPLGVDAASAGAEIFRANCVSCHGSQGHGDGPASEFLDPEPKNLAELQKMAADDYLFWRISTGKRGTSMVGWKGVLSDEQIWQVVSFIRTLE